MRHYERRLPHWDTVGQPLFVTFRLHGSLPANRAFPPENLAQSGKAFVATDRLLDRGSSGPLFLRRREIAELMVGALMVASGDSAGMSYIHTWSCRIMFTYWSRPGSGLRNGWPH